MAQKLLFFGDYWELETINPGYCAEDFGEKVVKALVAGG